MDDEGTPLPTFPPSRRLRRLDLKTYRMGGGVIGPRDNAFPGPAVALDGPGYDDLKAENDKFSLPLSFNTIALDEMFLFRISQTT